LRLKKGAGHGHCSWRGGFSLPLLFSDARKGRTHKEKNGKRENEREKKRGKGPRGGSKVEGNVWGHNASSVIHLDMMT